MILPTRGKEGGEKLKFREVPLLVAKLQMTPNPAMLAQYRAVFTSLPLLPPLSYKEQDKTAFLLLLVFQSLGKYWKVLRKDSLVLRPKLEKFLEHLTRSG